MEEEEEDREEGEELPEDIEEEFMASMSTSGPPVLLMLLTAQMFGQAGSNYVGPPPPFSFYNADRPGFLDVLIGLEEHGFLPAVSEGRLVLWTPLFGPESVALGPYGRPVMLPDWLWQGAKCYYGLLTTRMHEKGPMPNWSKSETVVPCP